MAVNPIMTQTLPTLVGMGVVSRAVDTTMGGRRRSRRGGVKKRSRLAKIHKGPRGGRYIIRKGRRVYI